jgi:hypothetical protein
MQKQAKSPVYLVEINGEMFGSIFSGKAVTILSKRACSGDQAEFCRCWVE